jgi:hypothetical protein
MVVADPLRPSAFEGPTGYAQGNGTSVNNRSFS